MGRPPDRSRKRSSAPWREARSTSPAIRLNAQPSDGHLPTAIRPRPAVEPCAGHLAEVDRSVCGKRTARPPRAPATRCPSRTCPPTCQSSRNRKLVRGALGRRSASCPRPSSAMQPRFGVGRPERVAAEGPGSRPKTIQAAVGAPDAGPWTRGSGSIRRRAGPTPRTTIDLFDDARGPHAGGGSSWSTHLPTSVPGGPSRPHFGDLDNDVELLADRQFVRRHIPPGWRCLKAPAASRSADGLVRVAPPARSALRPPRLAQRRAEARGGCRAPSEAARPLFFGACHDHSPFRGRPTGARIAW